MDAHLRLRDVLPSVAVDLLDENWFEAVGSLDLLVCCNVLHVSPWACSEALLRGRRGLTAGRPITYLWTVQVLVSLLGTTTARATASSTRSCGRTAWSGACATSPDRFGPRLRGPRASSACDAGEQPAAPVRKGADGAAQAHAAGEHVRSSACVSDVTCSACGVVLGLSLPRAEVCIDACASMRMGQLAIVYEIPMPLVPYAAKVWRLAPGLSAIYSFRAGSTHAGQQSTSVKNEALQRSPGRVHTRGTSFTTPATPPTTNDARPSGLYTRGTRTWQGPSSTGYPS